MQVVALAEDADLGAGKVSTAQVLVTTPRVWRNIVRGGGGQACADARLPSLVIIDEAHAMYDGRAAMLDECIALVLRRGEVRRLPPGPCFP